MFLVISRRNFVAKHLAIAMQHLLTILKGREKERSLAFVTVGLVAVAVGDDINPYQIENRPRNASALTQLSSSVSLFWATFPMRT